MGVTVRRKKPGGSWYLFVHHEGKRWSVVGGKTKAAAEEQAKEVRKALANDKLGIVDDKIKSFGYYCDKWITRFAPVNCAASTLNDYQAIVKNHLKPSELWDMNAKTIGKDTIEDFLMDKRANLSLSTVKHIKTCISQSLDRAVGKAGGLSSNPCADVKLKQPRRKNGKKKVNVYNEAETEKLLETFKQHAPRHYLMVLLMVRTGSRVSEVAALEWSDINLDNRIVTIRRGLVRGKLVDSTKSGEDRDVDLTPFLVKELRKAMVASGGSGLVFTNSAGNYIDFNTFRRRQYNKMVAKAGIKPTRLHDLRHTYASILLKKCRDILYVQKQLGHSKPSITLDIYSHFLEEDSPTRMVDMLDAPKSALCAPQKEEVARKWYARQDSNLRPTD